uniref:Uncharacterized protein n=1 Tax=Anguilla anguilla TaxID=7936 RepID=A0A0E9RZD9_ANGAN
MSQPTEIREGVGWGLLFVFFHLIHLIIVLREQIKNVL